MVINNANKTKHYPPQGTAPFAAYFKVPSVLVVSEDPTQSPNAGTDLLEEVYRGTLKSGIKVRVTRGGLFIFDFSKWAPGKSVTIPAHTSAPGIKTPKTVQDAKGKEQIHLARRVEVMNAHLACTATALSLVEKSGGYTGQLISPSDRLVLRDFEKPHPVFHFFHDGQPMHAYMLANGATETRLKGDHHRRYIKIETIVKSFEILDTLIESPISNAVGVVNLLWKSSRHYYQQDFATSLVLAWTVSEQLLNLIWKSYLSDSAAQNAGQDPPFLNKERKQKLTSGRDFSASVISEVLSLAGRLPFDLFKRMNKDRNARNYWLHDMKQPVDDDASHAISTAQKLIEHLSGVWMSVGIGYSTSFQYITPEDE